MTALAGHVVALAASRALLGRTWAQDRVSLEPADPPRIEAPTICVYAGHGHGSVTGRDLLGAENGLRLRFEFFLPAVVKINAGGPLTFDKGAGYAALFAGLWRQVETALLGGLGPWAEIFRAFCLRITAVEWDADFYEDSKGQKFPARIVELTFDAINDPEIGKPPTGAWADFLACLRVEDGETALLAGFYENLVRGDALAPDWRVAMASLGVGPASVAAMGLKPQAAAPDGSAPAMAAGELVDTDAGGDATTLHVGVADVMETPAS